MKYTYDTWLFLYELKKKYTPLPFFFFWLSCAACGILVPHLGVKPGPPAVKAPSPNHWTAREFPAVVIFKQLCFFPQNIFHVISGPLTKHTSLVI